jgi:YD repeat-containing protein
MRAFVIFAPLLLIGSAAHAAETITYTYDARGRLKEVAHSGTVNNGITSCYSYDRADNRTNLTVGTGPCPTPPGFAIGDASVTEGGTLVFTVTKTGTTSSSFSVDYATANGTAVAGNDYTASSGTLTFLSSDATKTISVTTIDDSAVESSETVLVNLSNATGGTTISDSQGVGTITDNDTSNNNPPNAVNNSGSQQRCDVQVWNVTANDTDPDGDYPLTVTAVSGLGFSVYSSSEIQFISTSSTGNKVGTYTVQDSRGATAQATLTINVTGGVCQ